jgi:hypothetical protein
MGHAAKSPKYHGSKRNYVRLPNFKNFSRNVTKEHSSIESIVALETPSQYVMTVAESQDQRGPLIALLPTRFDCELTIQSSFLPSQCLLFCSRHRQIPSFTALHDCLLAKRDREYLSLGCWTPT